MSHLTPTSDPFRVRDPEQFDAILTDWPVEAGWVGPDTLYLYQPDEDSFGGWRQPDDDSDGWPWTAVAKHLPPGEIATFYQCDCDDDMSDVCGSAVAIDSSGKTCQITLRSAITERAKTAGLGS